MFNSIAQQYNGQSNWDISTLYFYFSLVIFTSVIGYLAQHSKSLLTYQNPRLGFRKHQLNHELFFAMFLVLLLISGFRRIGADYLNYKDIFIASTTENAIYFSIEPGFLLVNKILSAIGLNFEVAIFIFSFTTIILVFAAIRDYANKINVSLALMAYVSLYYLPSFNMVRMYLAASIILYSYKFFLRGQMKKYLIVLSLTLFIHFSVFLFFFPIIGIWMFNKNKYWFWGVYVIGFILAFKAISMFSELTLIDRYTHYAEAGETEDSLGILHWIINIPIFVLYLYARKKIPNSPYLSSLLVLTFCEFLIGLLSYKIIILGRSLVYYNVLFIVIIPIVIQQLKQRHTRWCSIVAQTYYIYLFCRFYLYLKEYLYLDGIMPYKMIEL